MGILGKVTARSWADVTQLFPILRGRPVFKRVAADNGAA